MQFIFSLAFFNCSLLVHINVFILISWTCIFQSLLNSITSFYNLCMYVCVFLNIWYIQIMSSTNKVIFPSFQVDAFFFFPWRARTFSKILNKSDESWYPYNSDLVRSLLIFKLWVWYCYGIFIHALYQVKEVLFYI